MNSSYSVLRIAVDFRLEGASGEAEYASEWYPLDSKNFDQQEIEARGPVFDEIRGLLAPLLDHLASIGCVRADDTLVDETPIFHLIVPGDWKAPEYAGPQDGEPWINFGMVDQSLSSLPGATLKAHGYAEYVALEDTHSKLQAIVPGHDIGCWGGNDTGEKLPKPEEARSDWLARVAVEAEGVAAAFDRLERVGYDLSLYSLFFEPENVADTEWLVDGVIGFGALTLLVGCGASGKSSALHELISATNALSGPKTFLGRNVTDRCIAVLLSGEETQGALKYRQERHSKVWRGAEPMVVAGADCEDLRRTLNQLDRVPGRGLLVIDPAATFLDGDETKTHIVSEFYGPLVAFARRKDWAVVVAHHLVKDPPKALSRILSSVKGSTVHTDRARMVIAMIDRRNGTVEVGPIKHNYPEGAWLQIDQGQFFRRDPDTFRLTPVDADLPKAPAPEHELLQLIYSVIARLNDQDITVHRTGRFGLYKLQVAELQGVPRNVLENGVLTLLEAGGIINSAKGLVAVKSPQALHPVP